MPEEVKILPSSTQRAFSTQVTLSDYLVAKAKNSLLDVALLPSSTPALARSAEPEQTDQAHADESIAQVSPEQNADAHNHGYYNDNDHQCTQSV